MRLDVENDHRVPERTLLVGCGQVGTSLASHLIARGGNVIGLRRQADKLPDTMARLSVNLLEPVPRSLPEVDAIVITLTPTIGGPHLPQGYVTALENLAQALPATPRRILFVSSTGIYEGSSRGRALTEADAPEPVTPRGLVLLAGEQRAQELFGAHVIRPAGIYGPGRERLLTQVINGDPVPYKRSTNRIHQVDLVAGLATLLAMPDPPTLVHAVDERPAPLGDVVAFIARELGVEQPPRVMPEEASGAVYNGARMHALLGRLRYPSYEDGYREIIADRRGNARMHPHSSDR